MNSNGVVSADLEPTWAFLEPRISSLFTNVESGITAPDYMNIYTVVYNHCQKRHNNDATHLQIDFTGAQLYDKLKSFMEVYLNGLFKDVRRLDGLNLLQFYAQQWTRFTTAAKCLHNMFSYLNRHWIKRQNIEDHRNIHDVYTLCVARWRDVAFRPRSQDLTGSVLAQVREQRDGAAIDTGLIKSTVDSIVALGFDDFDADRMTLEFYHTHFERPFKEEAITYYQAESQKFLANHSVTEYMKKAETRLKEEEERVELCFHPSSLPAIKEVCEETLVAKYATNFTDEFQTLLDNDRVTDMGRMCGLLSRIPNGLTFLRDKFESHVKAHGLLAVNQQIQEGTDVEPKQYIDAMLQVHTKFATLVGVAFNNDPGFVAALDKACREFVNRNRLCKATSPTKTPELLARYCDVLLKKSQKLSEEADVEELLNSMMVVFKYIEDKDVFQKYYTQTLAKRLVMSLSASDDLETSMIGKLKEACGFEYTSKLQKMFTDISLSKELNDGFKNRAGQSGDDDYMVDLNLLVLSSASWPFKANGIQLNLPQELQRPLDRFKHHYVTKHSARKLTMLWQHCRAEIKATFSKAVKTPYHFTVSTYQACLMLLYNRADSYTLKELSEHTNLEGEALTGPLGILVKSKILNIDGGKEVGDESTSYSLNFTYKNKRLRMNLNQPIKSETKQEALDTQKHIEEDRKMYIQAAIVRIMKARKEMNHTALVSETIVQLKSRFMPVIADIKKCLDILIEKDYIMRSEEDRDIFVYLA